MQALVCVRLDTECLIWTTVRTGASAAGQAGGRTRQRMRSRGELIEARSVERDPLVGSAELCERTFFCGMHL